MGNEYIRVSEIPIDGKLDGSFTGMQRESHRIPQDLLPGLHDRMNMARPYPSTKFDLLAVNVPTSFQQGVIPDGEEPPHGMLRVVSSARAKSWNAGILDPHRLKLTPEQISHQLQLIQPRLVGLNPTSVNVPEGQMIAGMCHQLGIPFILGGIHATLDHHVAMIDFPNAAVLVRGNGEIAVNQVLSALLKSAPQQISGGIYYRGVDNSGRTDYAPKLNPGAIPRVDQGLLVEAPVYSHEVMIDGRTRVIREATLFATDGCPFDCTFCSSPVMVGRNVKGMTPYARPEMPRIIDDMTHCIDDLGADAIHFLDDMAFVTPEHMHDLHKGMKDKGLMDRVIWRGLTRAPVINRFDDSTMQYMKESGAWKIALGVESGDPDILKQIRKKVTPDQVIGAVQKLTRFGIQSKGFFIMGFPGETERQMEATHQHMMLLRSLGMTQASVFQFKPYPGTEAYKDLITRQPDILGGLTYLRRGGTGLGQIVSQKVEGAAWLPPDLTIAAVKSSVVQTRVETALADFYKGSNQAVSPDGCV